MHRARLEFFDDPRRPLECSRCVILAVARELRATRIWSTWHIVDVCGLILSASRLVATVRKLGPRHHPSTSKRGKSKTKFHWAQHTHMVRDAPIFIYSTRTLRVDRVIPPTTSTFTAFTLL